VFLYKVSLKVHFPLGPVGAVRAGELWLDTALVAEVSLEVLDPLVGPPAVPTSVTRERELPWNRNNVVSAQCETLISRGKGGSQDVRKKQNNMRLLTKRINLIHADE
jgi:hypothetical protein